MAKSSVQAKLADQWDSLKCRCEQPSPECLHRVKNDVPDFFAKPPAGLFIYPDEDDVTKVDALVAEPPGTPYDGGFFQFLVKFPPDCTVTPPLVRIITTGSHQVRFNLNLYANSNFCLSILTTWYGPAWSPALCLESVLFSIQSLLNENPYYTEPDKNPSRRSAAFARSYSDMIQYETMRVAVCDILKAALNDSPLCPLSFRTHILKSFSDSYDRHEGVAKKNLHLTGTWMGELQYGGVFNYENLERMKRLKRMMKEEVDGGTVKENHWKTS